MSELSMPLAARTRLRDYEIQELVGSGGFGFVYRAFDNALRREVAIKEYFPKFIATRGSGEIVHARLTPHQAAFRQGLESFLGEARVLAQFDDPAIVKVHLYWEQNGTAYMVMPFYEGITLRRLALHQRELITPEWLAALLQNVLPVLECLHRRGVFHLDLSPENILILKSGGMVLLDFGSSLRAAAPESRDIVLKPGYAPIEQYLSGETEKQGPWTDLYSLGAVLHFLLRCLAPPNAMDRVGRDPYQALASEAVRFPRVPLAILAAIDRCLCVQPADRPRDVAELQGLLAFDLQPVGGRFDLYRGVKKPIRYPATCALPLGEESDLTIPLDPGALAPAGSGSAAQQPDMAAIPAAADLPAQPAPAECRPQAGQAPVTAAGAPGAEAKEEPWRCSETRTGSRKARIGLLAVFLVALLAAPAYLMLPPPLKKEAAPPARAPTAAPVARDGRLSPGAIMHGEAEARAPAGSGIGRAADAMPKPAQAPDAAARADRDLAGSRSEPVERNSVREPGPAAGLAVGTIRLDVKPWGRLAIDGRMHGATPPLRRVKLSPGKHRIEISNPGFPSFQAELDVVPGASTVVKHAFE